MTSKKSKKRYDSLDIIATTLICIGIIFIIPSIKNSNILLYGFGLGVWASASILLIYKGYSSYKEKKLLKSPHNTRK